MARRHTHKKMQTDYHKANGLSNIIHQGRCPDCGKLMFATRKAAKVNARRNHKDEQMSIYRCGDYWHYGHPWGHERF
jgi:uncharacterized OB-fold protein